MIQAHQLTERYGDKTVVDGISFAINAGSSAAGRPDGPVVVASPFHRLASNHRQNRHIPVQPVEVRRLDEVGRPGRDGVPGQLVEHRLRPRSVSRREK